MARYYDDVGFAVSEETAPGVFRDVITTKKFFGTIVENIRRLEGQDVNADIKVTNAISIVADPYAMQNFHAIRYAKWMGILWTVQTVEVRAPRLLLRLGEVYNGEPGGPS
jgi:hypothetical protein